MTNLNYYSNRVPILYVIQLENINKRERESDKEAGLEKDDFFITINNLTQFQIANLWFSKNILSKETRMMLRDVH